MREVLDRGPQPALLEQRRAEAAGKVAELSERAEGLVARLADGGPGRFGVIGDLSLGHPELHRERDEAGLSPVVQITLDPPELLIRRGDDIRARTRELADPRLKLLALAGAEDARGERRVAARDRSIEQQRDRQRAQAERRRQRTPSRAR